MKDPFLTKYLPGSCTVGHDLLEQGYGTVSEWDKNGRARGVNPSYSLFCRCPINILLNNDFLAASNKI